MFVVNTIGYNFSFKYNGVEGEGVITIPFDQRPYRVPNDIHKFKELKEVIMVDAPGTPEKKEEHKPVENGTSVKSLYGGYDYDVPKTNIEKVNEQVEVPKVEEVKKKPLAGVKIKKKIKKKILSKKV